MGLLSPSRLELLGVTGGDVLIETGTDGGMSLLRCSEIFKTIHTIELNIETYRRGVRRLRKRQNIIPHFGNSPEVLAKIIDSTRETVFWLDAHFMGTGPCLGPQCPLLDELKAILAFTWSVQPTIIVDDARMFGDWFWERRVRCAGYIREQWPKLQEIEALVGEHGFAVQSIKGMLLIERKGGEDLLTKQKLEAE